MLPEFFADEIGLIGFSNGVVRIDFASINSSTTPQSSNKMMTLRQRVVMPIDGFMRSLKTMQDLAEKLEQSGMVTEQQPNENINQTDEKRQMDLEPELTSPNF